MFCSYLIRRILLSVLIIFNLLVSLSYATPNPVDEDGLDAQLKVYSSENGNNVGTSQVTGLSEPQPLISIKFNPDKFHQLDKAYQQQILSISTFKEETLASDGIKAFLASFQELIPNELDSTRFKTLEQFILSTQIFLCDERAWSGNLPDLKKRTVVEFKDNGVLYQNDQILDSDEEGLWALNPKGKLCIYFCNKHPDIKSAVHHSFFFKKNFIGQAVACVGHIKVCKGKITSISNDSGRYQPIDPQLLLSVKYLYFKNVLDPKIIVKAHAETSKHLSLGEALIIACSIELNS